MKKLTPQERRFLRNLPGFKPEPPPRDRVSQANEVFARWLLNGHEPKRVHVFRAGGPRSTTHEIKRLAERCFPSAEIVEVDEL